MPLAQPSPVGLLPSIVVDPIQILFGRHVGCYPDTTPLGLKVWRLGARF